MYSVLTWTLFRQKFHKTISHFFTSYWIYCTSSTNRQVPLFFSFPLLIPFITLNIPRSGLMNSTAQQVHKYLKHKNMYVTYTNKSCNKYLSSSFPINYIVVVVVVIVYICICVFQLDHVIITHRNLNYLTISVLHTFLYCLLLADNDTYD